MAFKPFRVSSNSAQGSKREKERVRERMKSTTLTYTARPANAKIELSYLLRSNYFSALIEISASAQWFQTCLSMWMRVFVCVCVF